MPCDPRRSLITHPDAILFLRILRERVFQQVRLLTTVDLPMVSGSDSLGEKTKQGLIVQLAERVKDAY